MSVRRITSAFLPQAVRYARSRGVDERALVDTFGADVVGGASASIAADVLARTMERLERILGEPHFALSMATTTPRGTWGIAELTARTAPNVGSGMRRAARYSRIVPPFQSLAWSVDGGEVRCSYESAVARPGNEFAVARLFRFVEELAGRRLTPRAIWFANAPVDTRTLREHFGAPEILFDAEDNGFSLDASVDDLPVVTDDPVTHRLLTEYAEQLLPAATSPDPLVADLRAAIARELQGGTPQLEHVARVLGVNARTLQRRLSEKAVTFSDLVDSTRRDLAQKHLANRDLAVEDVAFLLGFADGRAFARSFRRWTGTSPSEWRARL